MNENGNLTGQEILDEQAWKGESEIEYGVLLEPEEYELVYMAIKEGITEGSPLFLVAVSIVEDLAKENSPGGVVISRRDYEGKICKIEVLRNVTRQRDPQQDKVA